MSTISLFNRNSLTIISKKANKMKKVLLLALPLMASIVSCSDDDGPSAPVYEVITFESCEFAEGKTNNVSGSTGEYKELDATFAWKDYYTMVGGDVVSSLAMISEAGTPTATSVALPEGTEHAGADGSDKFLVLLNDNYVKDFLPEFSFAPGMERQIVSLQIMNSTAMYQYMKYGYYSYAPMAAGDYCDATITGYDAQGNETAAVTVTLADFRDGKEFIMEQWTEIDLTALGAVNKVAFALTWPDSWSKPSPKNYSVCIRQREVLKG